VTKLFTVGCSLTRYVWPTWADILGRSFDQFENWGHSGIGNRAIFERTIELIATSQPTSDDLIIIQWTNPYRFDAHKINHDIPVRWACAGNLGNWPRELAEVVDCEFSYVYHTCNFIIACKNVLENKKLKYIFFLKDDLQPDMEKFSELDIYAPEINNIEWFYPISEWVRESGLPLKEFKQRDFFNLKTLKDEHPTPMAHYLYLEQILNQELNLKLDKEWAMTADKLVFQSQGYKELFESLKNDLDWIEYNTIVKGL
jgi:hypothetical protein